MPVVRRARRERPRRNRIARGHVPRSPRIVPHLVGQGGIAEYLPLAGNLRVSLRVRVARAGQPAGCTHPRYAVGRREPARRVRRLIGHHGMRRIVTAKIVLRSTCGTQPTNSPRFPVPNKQVVPAVPRSITREANETR